jgi:murein DD-endopeptidase MepM/ murein hydrolase activator NlpD
LNRRSAQVIALGIVAAVAFGAAAALRLNPPELRAPGERLGNIRVPKLWSRKDTLARGESLASLLARAGLDPAEAADALRAADGLNDRRVPAGMEVRVDGDSGRTEGPPTDIVFQLSPERALHLTRDGDHWVAKEEKTTWATDTVVVHAVIHRTLYDALDEGAGSLLSKGARAELAWTIADIYEYRIDMSRELQDGDRVRVVFERSRLPSGRTKIGTIFAAGVERSGDELQAVRYQPRDGTKPEYFDQKGRSLRAQFLRAPLSFRRISSVFGMRKHPILGEWRAHKGTDYSAASGTPVRSIGDGTVIFSGVKSGFGNVMEVRHPNGYVTRYGHLKGFAKGVRAGSHVSMGSTIGYVGMTGLATAPHLHFEVLVGGVQRDPRGALSRTAGVPLSKSDLGPFQALQLRATKELERPNGPLARPAPVH